MEDNKKMRVNIFTCPICMREIIYDRDSKKNPDEPPLICDDCKKVKGKREPN